VRKFEGRLAKLERRNLSSSCVGSPLVFLLPGDYPADAPPRHPRCQECGEHHAEFDGVGRRVVLLVDNPEGP
jgi:hypothetical protein